MFCLLLGISEVKVVYACCSFSSTEPHSRIICCEVSDLNVSLRVKLLFVLNLCKANFCCLDIQHLSVT